MLVITVYGTPAPQGSKKFLGVSKGGRGVMVESSKKVPVWREAVKWAFLEKYGHCERPAVPGAVAVEMTFTLARPKSTKRKLPSVKPDLSKLVRCTEDSLTEVGAYEDDARIVREIVSKVYVGDAGALSSPGAVIRIKEVL